MHNYVLKSGAVLDILARVGIVTIFVQPVEGLRQFLIEILALLFLGALSERSFALILKKVTDTVKICFESIPRFFLTTQCRFSPVDGLESA